MSCTVTDIEPPRSTTWMERGLQVMLIWIALASVGVAVLLAYRQIDLPGYDFRYFWIAGRVWLEGASPYGSVFHETGARLITEGHVPEIWPYPPNLVLPTVGIGLFELHTAWTAWIALHLLVIIAASAVLAFGLPLHWLPGTNAQVLRLSRLGFFALHLAVMAAMEANYLSIISGQFAGVLYLALCTMIVGLARGRTSVIVVVALSVTFMKPQIGGILAIGLMLSGRQGIRLVIAAAIASVIMMLPALVIRPTALLDWLHVLGDYDGVNQANRPVSMTGLRNLFWVFGGMEISNLAAMLLAIPVAAGAALCVLRSGDRFGRTGADQLTAVAVAMVLVALACAPLHMYDFVFFGVSMLAFVGVAGVRLAAAVFCTALSLLPTGLYLWITGGPAWTMFLGSTLATVAALMVLLLYLTRSQPLRTEVAAAT